MILEAFGRSPVLATQQYTVTVEVPNLSIADFGFAFAAYTIVFCVVSVVLTLIFHRWRAGWSMKKRVVVASAFMPLLIFLGLALVVSQAEDQSIVGEFGSSASLGLVVIMLATIVSSIAAFLVSKRLSVRDDSKTFE